MRRVLFVAYYFPPIAGIGSIRAASFASHLPEFGWEPTVVAPRRTPHPADPDLVFREDRVVRSHSIELSRLKRVVQPLEGSTDAATPTRRPRSALRDTALRFVFPDAQIGWYPGAVAAGLRAIRTGRFDAVYSSSFPITAHLVGMTLGRRAGIPWIAEFRDPWSDTLPDNSLAGAARALESAIAKRSERLVMPTPTWAATFGNRWGIDVAVLPNGHEGAVSPIQSPTTSVLTHLGSLYPARQDLSALWEALRRLAHADDVSPPRVRFVGELDAGVRAEISRYGVGHLVEATGLVPHSQAMSLIASSSILFASGGAVSDPMARGWIPAKLFEYLPTGLPILYLGDPSGDAARMLAEHPGCEILSPRDPDAVEAALRRALAAGFYERDVTPLSREARAGQLAAILDQATQPR